MNARSVLECGGKSDATPLSNAAPRPAHSQRIRPCESAVASDLPAQSKIRWHVALLACLAFVSSAQGQSFSLDWFTIDGGGGASTGGPMIGNNYSVSGTIGQPDAGPTMTNGQYAVTGGFWALPTAIQTPGAPMLAIVPAGAGQAQISWTPNTSGFILQETSSLSPTNWINSPSGSTNPIVVPATLPTKFYRLFKP